MKLYAALPGKIFFRGNTLPVAKADKQRTVERENIRFAVSLFMRDGQLASIVEHAGGSYWHHAIPDGDQLVALPLDLMAQQLAFELKALGAAGMGSLLVNCRFGRNRSALLAAMVLRHLRGVSGQTARNAVKTARPDALQNETFVKYLASLPAPTTSELLEAPKVGSQ